MPEVKCCYMYATKDNISGTATLESISRIMNTNRDIKVDPVTLDGLEPLLDQAHIEVVEPVDEGELELEKTSSYYETRTMLELLGQVQQVHELLSETNRRLTRAYTRIKHMERVVDEQEERLKLLPALEEQANKAAVLQGKLDEALGKLEAQRQPWWHRLSR